MIKVNGRIVDIKKFPDGTPLMKETPAHDGFLFQAFARDIGATITWNYERNEELMFLIFLTKHLRNGGYNEIYLEMPYIPNARQDRVKNPEDVFTLKYFADVINWLDFKKVTVLDPHSTVSQALIDRIRVKTPRNIIASVMREMYMQNPDSRVIVHYPDEGAMKRYSGFIGTAHTFGIKNRDWGTGEILGLSVMGATDLIAGNRVLIVDDICSRGGTFFHSAKKLKELGASEVSLFVTHCENTILQGDLLEGDLIKKIYTTNSIFTKEHEKIEVFDCARY